MLCEAACGIAVDLEGERVAHGWGHGRPGIALGVASVHAGASLNHLTDDRRIDALCGTADFAVDVAVEPAR